MKRSEKEAWSAAVIGLDGVGRQLAMQLAALGPNRLLLIDSGVVSRVQQTRQGYFADDVGRPRRHATAELCHQLNPVLDVIAAARVAPQELADYDLAFCCSGSAAQRLGLLRRVGPHVRCYVDVQIRGSMVQILTARDAHAIGRCVRMLEHGGAGRGASDLHLAAVAAGMAISLALRVRRGVPVPAVIHLDVARLKPRNK